MSLTDFVICIEIIVGLFIAFGAVHVIDIIVADGKEKATSSLYRAACILTAIVVVLTGVYNLTIVKTIRANDSIIVEVRP